MLPDYTILRYNLVLTRRIELLSIGYQPIALPLSYMRIDFQFIEYTTLFMGAV